jgi:hypothetical protein
MTGSQCLDAELQVSKYYVSTWLLKEDSNRAGTTEKQQVPSGIKQYRPEHILGK